MFEHDNCRFTLVGVVAMARNRAIGLSGEMPWRLKADLKRYRALTTGRPMVMGRKTLLSIGRLLDGRDTVVLTRSGTAPVEGAHVADAPEAALRLAAGLALARGTDEIAIVGGAEIYAAFLDRTDRIEATEVEADPEADTFFPPLDPALWTRGEPIPMEARPGDTAPARFVTFTRQTDAASSRKV